MAITFGDDGVIIDNGNPIIFPSDGTGRQAAVLAAFDDSGAPQLLTVDSMGALRVTASLSNINIYPQVDMLGRDATNTRQFLQVELDPVTGREALIVNDPRLTFVGDELKVIADLSLTTVGIENSADVRIDPATEQKQNAGNASLVTIAGKDFATQTTLAALNAKFTTTASGIKVDGSAVTQPVSGPLTDAQLRASAVPVSGTFFQATQPVSIAAVVAVSQSGAWTTGRTWTLSSGTDSVAAAQSGAWSVTANIGTTNGLALDTSLQSILTDLNKFSFNGALLRVDASGATVPISATALPLPAGASTEATLAAIKTQTDKLTFTGTELQVLADVTLTATAVGIEDAGSVRINPSKEDGNLLSIKVDLDKFTFTATRLLVDGSGVTQPVSGTVAATQSGAWTTGRTWSLSSGADSIAAIQSGTWTVQPGNTANTTAWLVTGAGGTFPITAISLPLPTGAATETTLAAIKTDADKFTFTATRLLVDGSGVTQPVSAVSLPLPAGAATEATLATRVADTTITNRLGADVEYTAENYTTTNSDANARPINGDFATRRLKTKELVVQNMGANGARITVKGSVDGGATFPIVLSNNTLIAAGNVLEVAETRAFTHVQVLARASSAGNQTTINTSGYAQAT